MSAARLLHGDALAVLKTLPDESVRCCVTSPPYWGLRDYGACSCGSGRYAEGQSEALADKNPGNRNYRTGRPVPTCRECNGTGRLPHAGAQLGLERSPEEYVARLVEVFREVRRVLTSDASLWLNLGDSYASAWPAPNTRRNIIDNPMSGGKRGPQRQSKLSGSLKEKDLVGIPWSVAFALRADGWYLRSDIIWSKPNPMPESVTDRPTRAHEYVFLLSKAARYYYDAAAIRTPQKAPTTKMPDGWDTGLGGHGSFHRNGREKGRRTDKQRGHSRRHAGFNDRWDTMERDEQIANGANARSVWEIATQPYPEAHFATFPEELAQRCILAGSAPGDVVLDPFCGSGTTCAVAVGHGRDAIGIDLNPKYLDLARQRIGPLLCDEAVTA